MGTSHFNKEIKLPNYHDYFSRVQDIVPKEIRDLEGFDIVNDSEDHKSKLVNLFVECFDHHTKCTSQPMQTELEYRETERRFISQDSLLTRYLDKYYFPPTIIKGYRPKNEIIGPESRLTFNQLSDTLINFPITADPLQTNKIGSNTYSYLIGDVGAGKTSIICALYRNILFNKLDPSGYKVIPIYINVDHSQKGDGTLVKIDQIWFDNFVNKIKEQLDSVPESYKKNIKILDFQDNKNDTYVIRLRALTTWLAAKKIRLMIFFDNLDRYHFHYTKHRFTKEFSGEQRSSVIDNLSHLIGEVTSDDSLGCCGLCIAFVCRSYVYKYLRSSCEDQSKVDAEFGRVFTVEVEDPFSVLNSRMNLFEEAIGIVSKHNPKLDLVNYQHVLLALLRFKTSSDELRPEIDLIAKLGHHGLRSLVGFIGALRLDLTEVDAFTRLLSKQIKMLPILFLLKVKRRFAQNNNHFPNIFLIDAQVAIPEKYKSAYESHKPTYWLKYFILKYIENKKSVKFEQLRRIFVIDGGYEDSLFRLVVGSLTSTNESRCIDIDPTSELSGVTDCELFLTRRGIQLVTPTSAFGGATIDFCFEFAYLQLVLDDSWLSLPEFVANEIISDLSYAYFFDADKPYGLAAEKMVNAKSLKTSKFCQILDAALKSEEKQHPTLFKLLRSLSLIPNMLLIQSDLRASVLSIEQAMKLKTISDTSSIFPSDDRINSLNIKLEDFYKAVRQNKIEVQS
jgi:hypothetical protein